MTHAGLVNVTDHKIVDGTELEKSAISQQLAEKQGWYIDMEGRGEKVLNPSVTIDHKIVFTSYVPGEVSNCAVGLGTSNLYVVDILDARSVVDQDDNGVLTKSDGKSELGASAISAPPSILFPAEGESVDVVVGSEVASSLAIQRTQRTYWSETPDF